MSIVNDFKKILKPGEEASSDKKKKTAIKKIAKAKKPSAKPEKIEKIKNSPAKKMTQDKNPDIYKVLKRPLITEKTSDLSLSNKYIFVVGETANKNEVKKSVESLYKVNVLSVNIVKVPRKKRHRGRVAGWKSGFKKAIVTIKEGDKIEIISH